MTKKLGVAAIIMVFMVVTIGVAMAEGKGNARKGKYLFRKSCRTCHIEDGSAKDLSPVSKTQADWQIIFDNTSKLQCKEEWEKLSEKDILDIHAHLWGHAFDSPSPAKCK
ncbi:MAG: cytochrome c [Desulfobacteraceae bacterium]|nr:cytochrome c [Desulfobacteraceae bacterium]